MTITRTPNDNPAMPTEVRTAFRAGKMDKYEYSQMMHRLHGLLFDYAKLIRGTQVGSIEISEAGVKIVTRDSIGFVCDPADQHIPPVQLMNFGDYEAAERALVRRLVSPGMNVFDIGANVGWYSLLIAKTIPNTRVLAFEPLPATFASLQQNVSVNRLANIEAYNFGLSDHDGTDVFYFAPEISGAASGANILGSDPNRDYSCQEIQCRVRRLDDVWKEVGARVDFIKCDVEGAELLVVRGGLDCLRSDQPIFLCEMLRKWSAKFGYHPNDIIHLLEGIGYACYAIAGSDLTRFGRMDEATVETNFCFLHSEKHRELIAKLEA